MNKTAKLLIVDDDPAILRSYADILRAEGYEVWEAATGQQGVEAARERRPDMVLLDVMLPDISGIEVCRQIKADAALTDVFVVLFSGTATSAARKVEGLESGADDYLVKGLNADEFLARVRTILRLREATAALRASEQHHRWLLEVMPEGVIQLDLQGRVLGLNPRGVAMLGYADAAELLQKSAFDLTLPEDHERIRADLATTLAKGMLRNAEYTLLKKGRQHLLAELSAAVSTDSIGRPYGFVLVARDISERKQFENALTTSVRALRDNMLFLQTLIEAIPYPIFYKDASGRYLGCNHAFEQHLGLSRQQILRKTVYDLAPKDLADTYHQADLELLRKPGIQTYESSVVYGDGSRHEVLFNKATFENAEGEVAGLVGTIIDLTERKRVEEQVRLLAAAVQSTSELISITDQEDHFTYANRAFLEAYGYRLEELRGKTPRLLYSPRNPPGLGEQIFRQTMKGGWQGELFNCTKEGTEFPISLSTSQIKDDQGRVLGLLGVAKDISERKRTEQQEIALAHLGYRLSATSSPDQAAQVIFETASDFFDWDAGYVALYSQAENRVIPILVFDVVGGQRTLRRPTSAPHIPTPLMRLVIKEGPRLLGEAGDLPPDLKPAPFDNLDRLSASIMIAPISFVGGVVGILSLQRYRPRAYSPVDLKLLQGLADHCGGALQRIKVTEALREAEANYRSIFENATEGIFQTSPAGRYLSANPALARMAGYQSPEELIASVTDIDQQTYVSPERRIELKRLLEAQGSVQGFEAQFYRKDGSKVWMSVNARVVRDTSGAVLYYEGTNQDITERKAAEEALQQAEANYRSIFENATDGIFVTTTEGRFRNANPALARMLGYQTPEELIASVNDLERQFYVKPERRQEFKRLIEQEGSVREFEFEHFRKDGSIIWVSVNAHVVRDASGAVLHYEGTLQNITERKCAEEALQLSQILQTALLDNIPDPAWLKDTEGRFLACNEPLARLLRQPRPAIVGRTLFDLDPQEAGRLTAEDKEVMQAGKPGRFEWRRTDHQGHVGWFETIKSPLLGEEGGVTGTVGIARDITERKQVEHLLRRQRDFGIFLSSTDDLEAAVERLLKIALENEGLDCGAVYLVNSQTNTLELTSHRGLPAGFSKRSSRLTKSQVQDRLAPTRKATSRGQIGPMASVVQQLKREGLLALEVVPIQHNGEVVAVLNVGSRVHREIPRGTRQAIEALAAQAGGAITRIRAEQSMRTARQLLEKTIHSLHAGVLIIDADTTTIQECNPAATRLFGYSREEMIGQSPALLHLSEAMREGFRQHLAAAIKEKGLLSEFEFLMKRKDGTSFPGEHTVVPIRNEEGSIVTWVGVVRDLTERKRTEEGLRDISRHIIQAQEAERQRVARDLHDSVNQVIASAKMRLRTVEALVALNPGARELLARCNELLVQALEENRRIAHDLRPTDLDALGLADACRNFCRQFQTRTNLVVKTRLARFAQRCPPAMELNLFRIVQEALNNIEKHARARTVRLQIALQRGGLLLRIQDDGRGFDPQTVKPARRKEGGVGLTNIRERAAILGGTCEVVSAPKQGTAIIVRVPCLAH